MIDFLPWGCYNDSVTEEYSSWSKRRDSKSRRARKRCKGSNPFSSAKNNHTPAGVWLFFMGCGIRKIKSKLPVAAWSPTAGRRRNLYLRKAQMQTNPSSSAIPKHRVLVESVIFANGENVNEFLLRCPVCALPTARLRCTPTAATRSAR